ncbi:MAG: HD domain-containing protein [Chloroflexota bacterium]
MDGPLTAGTAGAAGAPPFPVVPDAWLVLERLWHAGHAAYLVGGAVRDALLGRVTHDWDVATDARPETILGLFPEGEYENRFGTVLAHGVEITTFRRDHQYPDHRRPAQVTFTDDVTDDLLRRDFTVNAIAWGRPANARPEEAHLVDPSDGLADLRARLLRAVGDPSARFDEDALRLLRAARIASAVGLEVEPATFAAMARHADHVRWVSGERVGIELRRMVEAEVPSRAFRIMAATGLLRPVFPELAAQIGVPQAKLPGMDCFDHTMATLDAASVLDPGDERMLLCALLHDTGKPATLDQGHFHGHEQVGAVFAEALLDRVTYPRRESRIIGRIIRGHMFTYSAAWSDAAVRRFIVRVGADVVDDVLRLRRADNVGSGSPPDDGGVDELRARVAAQRAAGVPLAIGDLAVDGEDLMADLGRSGGPWLGRLLERLLESVIEDPSRNTRHQLLVDARAWSRET